MSLVGSAMLRTIRSFAETSDDPNVYTLAQIPEPAAPGPVGPSRPAVRSHRRPGRDRGARTQIEK